MRYLPGQPRDIANESISSHSLMDAAVANADILPTVFELWKEEESPLTSLLNVKGMKTTGLFDGMVNKNYRVVKSNHVQYAIKSSDKRKLRIRSNPDVGATFYSPTYPTQPGFNQTPFYIFCDSNWAGPKEILELNDNDTQLYIYDDNPPVEFGDAWRYEVKLITTVKEDFVDVSLLAEGNEIGVVSTMDIHDFSETGVEKYTFDGWGHAYMTLQRLKYSWSGTAAAMKEDKLWTIHNGQQTFLTHAQNEMMKRAAQYHEYWMIWGKGTVSMDGEVLMKDKKNREVMAGQGVIHQNDGAYEYPYNKWTMKFIESLMEDADIRAGMDGLQEIVFLGGRKAVSGFSQALRDAGFVTQNNNVVGDGASKGVINTYSYYEVDGVRIIPKRYRWLDSQERASMYLDDGTRKGSWDGIFVPLGNTQGGDKGVELVQLRPPKTGTVSGIDKGGEMATSVDGSHKHVLFQTGIISRNKIQKIFRPVQSDSVYLTLEDQGSQ